MCQKSPQLGARNSEATEIFLTRTLNQTFLGKINQQLLAESALKLVMKFPQVFFIIIFQNSKYFT